MSLFGELKRRNVFRVGAAYAVASWLLIQVAATIFPLFGFDDTPARIVVIVLAIGLIPVLVFAWAFELTPDGLKKESEVDRSHSIAPQTGKKLDRVIMAVLALALGYFAFDNFVLDPLREAGRKEKQAEQLASATQQAREEGRSAALAESYGDKSIAVLAFNDMSPEGDQEYLSDGIAEELLNVLAKIPELRVISRTSAFSYKGKNIRLTQVAEELKVAHVLEGSVRKFGTRVRITAQLIDARSDTHLWSDTYDRQLDDIFAIQDEIAAAVAEQLKATLLEAAPRAQRTDPEAYALYLKGRHLGRLNTAESLEQSSALYQQALAIDPNYAPAWASLARNYNNQADAGLLTQEEAYARAREAAGQALALDPGYAPAHSRLGWMAMQYENDLARSARHFEQALALDPTNTDIIANAAVLLWSLGRLEEAIAFNEFANTRDPLNPGGYYNLGSIYRSAERWDDAIAAYQMTLGLSPDRIGAHYQIGMMFLFEGEAAAALEAFGREEGDEEYRVKGQALALYALRRMEEFRARLDDLIERWGEQWPSEVAQVYAFTGDLDRTFLWLDRAVAQNESGLFLQFLDPIYRPVHADPRWARFRERVGSSPAQLASIEFVVKLPN